MKKRFLTKKKRKRYFWKQFFFFLSFVFLALFFTWNFLRQIHFSSVPSFFEFALEQTSHLMDYPTQSKTIVKQITQSLSNLDFSNPISLLENGFHYKLEEEYDPEVVMSFHFTDSNPTTISSPKVYLYNSHQLENYSTQDAQDYSVTPNVLLASYILREELNRKGVPTIVEEADITEFMRIHNWKYVDSYKASRYYLEDIMKKETSLEYFIDIHRDSVKKRISTVTIDSKDYAKILFVIGTDNKRYQENLKLANLLEQKMSEAYPGISRGVITHGGSGYNGVYNQDLSSNVLLLECGGYENTVTEVTNTMEAFSSVFSEFLGVSNEG